nr:transketolase domain protein [Rhodococcus sp. JVH1]
MCPYSPPVHPADWTELDTKAVDTIRVLTADAVQKVGNGHPEHGHTRGVEITTGPLGQGLVSDVGMAMAARRERGLFDPETALGDSPFDHHIYVIASVGDIEEGVTSEASEIDSPGTV